MKIQRQDIILYLVGALFLLSLIIFIICSITSNEDLMYGMIPGLAIGGSAFLTILIFRNENNKRTRKNLWLAIAITLPVTMAVGIPLGYPVAPIIAIVPVLLFCSFIFILTKKRTLAYSILIALLFLGFFLKSNRIPFTGILMSVLALIFSFGFLMLAEYSLLSIRKNTYLKIVACLAFITLAIATAAFTFKIQHWPGGGLLMRIQIFPFLLLTILVLTTLPFSGFTEWIEEHRRFFYKSILYPWIVFLIMGSSIYILPARIFNTIFPTGQQRPDEHFDMGYYNLEDWIPEDAGTN